MICNAAVAAGMPSASWYQFARPMKLDSIDWGAKHVESKRLFAAQQGLACRKVSIAANIVVRVITHAAGLGEYLNVASK